MSEARAPRSAAGCGPKAAVLAIVALVLIVVSHSLWLPSVGGFLMVADPLQEADAIVALAGGREHVIYGARLFSEGYARWFVATNSR